MITVMDLWRGALPAGTDLLGGRAGLERQVDWATSLRSRPPAFEAIKGGEIAFIAVRSIKLLDERLDLTRVLESFAEKGGVAAAVVGDVAAASIELADRLMLPLLLLPEQVHLADVHQATTRFILDQRTALHDRAQELQSELMELALNGAGPAGIVDRLAELLELATAWQDESGELRHEAGNRSHSRCRRPVECGDVGGAALRGLRGGPGGQPAGPRIRRRRLGICTGGGTHPSP